MSDQFTHVIEVEHEGNTVAYEIEPLTVVIDVTDLPQTPEVIEIGEIGGPPGPPGPPGPASTVPGPPGENAEWVQLTQAAYNALPVKDPQTLYVIIG